LNFPAFFEFSRLFSRSCRGAWLWDTWTKTTTGAFGAIAAYGWFSFALFYTVYHIPVFNFLPTKMSQEAFSAAPLNNQHFLCLKLQNINHEQFFQMEKVIHCYAIIKHSFTVGIFSTG
jgi:hypothetical protein